jgi:hypothetical protein
MAAEQRAGERIVTAAEVLSVGTSLMISARDYSRRMAALARAEAVRGNDGGPIPRFSQVAMARRYSAEPARAGVDPIAASRTKGAWLLQA